MCRGFNKLSIKIVTDSACDLPEDVLIKYEIEVVPFFILIDGQEYLDGINIKTNEVFDAIKEGKIPRTAQVAPEVFKKTFLKHAQKGEACIYIALSSYFSGSFQTSKLVADDIKKEYPDFKIHLIDSKSGSLAQGIIVLKAAIMAKEGKSLKEIIKTIEFQIRHIEHIFTVDDLEYLHRGGRLSKAASFIGSMLNIKPILHVKEGKMIPIHKIRGTKKAINKIVDIMEERGMELKKQIIGIVHADNLELAETLKEKIQERFGCENFIINQIGGVIGCHIGLNGVAAFFLNKI